MKTPSLRTLIRRHVKAECNAAYAGGTDPETARRWVDEALEARNELYARVRLLEGRAVSIAEVRMLINGMIASDFLGDHSTPVNVPGVKAKTTKELFAPWAPVEPSKRKVKITVKDSKYVRSLARKSDAKKP